MARSKRSHTQRRIPYQRSAPQGSRRPPGPASHHRHHPHGRHRSHRSPRHSHHVQRPDGVQSHRAGRTIRHTPLSPQRLLRPHHGRRRSARDHHHSPRPRRRHHPSQQRLHRARRQRQSNHLAHRAAHPQTHLHKDALRLRRLQRRSNANKKSPGSQATGSQGIPTHSIQPNHSLLSKRRRPHLYI